MAKPSLTAATRTGIQALIEARLPGATLAQDTGRSCRAGQPEGNEPALLLSPVHLVEACEILRDAPETQYDLLLALTRVGDQVHYQLASSSYHRRLRLCVPLPLAREPLVHEQNPSQQAAGRWSTIDSLSPVWPAADWAEREAQDFWDLAFQRPGRPRHVDGEHPPALEPLLVRTPWDPAAMQGDSSLITGMRYPTSINGLLLRLSLDGERVVSLHPELGYRHIGLEKRMMDWPYVQGTLLMARMDGFSAMQGDLAYALAVEKLLVLEPPPRAQQLRAIYAELQRIASHLFWLVRLAQNLSDPTWVAPAYAWEARSAILELFQWLGGNPVTPDLVAIGGLQSDTPPAFEARIRSLVDDLEAWLEDLDVLLTQNLAFRSHLDGVGILDPGTALGLGVTGPSLRASGVGYDVRTAFPYTGYHSLEIPVPLEHDGDASARFRVRMAEMRASVHLIRQIVPRLSEGPVNALDPEAGSLPVLPEGPAYASVEGSRGELGVYLVSRRSACKPTSGSTEASARHSGSATHLQHVHVRAPSFANLSALPYVARGHRADQVSTLLDSLDVSMGEVER